MRIDIHVHTRRYSPCSTIDPEALIGTAIQAGLNGVVITEHEYQWSDPELDALREASGMPGFLLLAGFEYRTVRGDVLVYGLDASACEEFGPGMTPREATALAAARGGVCIAAHPTREGMDFDMAIGECPLAAIEVCSTNLRTWERRSAANLATALHLPAIAASDAHALTDLGRYATEFETFIDSMAGLHNALRNGKFQLPEFVVAEMEIS